MSETEQKEIPLCKNCKHINYTNLAANWKFWECHHPNNYARSETNPVNGDPKLKYSPSMLRSEGENTILNDTFCGPEGKWYESNRHFLFLKELYKTSIPEKMPIVVTPKTRIDSLR